MATTYGMWRDSVLNRCSFFHVTEGLVPDIMHDILVGSLELCMRYCLSNLICDRKLLSLSYLNRRIRSFQYGVDALNKPSEIAALSTGDTIKQSGKYLQFILFLPFIKLLLLQHHRCGAWLWCCHS